jgi:hypothetical protein
MGRRPLCKHRPLIVSSFLSLSCRKRGYQRRTRCTPDACNLFSADFNYLGTDDDIIGPFMIFRYARSVPLMWYFGAQSPTKVLAAVQRSKYLTLLSPFSIWLLPKPGEPQRHHRSQRRNSRSGSWTGSAQGGRGNCDGVATGQQWPQAGGLVTRASASCPASRTAGNDEGRPATTRPYQGLQAAFRERPLSRRRYFRAATMPVDMDG